MSVQLCTATNNSELSTAPSLSAASHSASLSQNASQIVESIAASATWQMHAAGNSQLSRGTLSSGELLVTACGRTCTLEREAGDSIIELKRNLQNVLSMEGQTFHVFDICGSPILTDVDLRGAIDNGHTPLVATLTDATIHDIENRREELAQMQWKLIRDQMAAILGKLGTCSRQIGELQLEMDTVTREREMGTERARAELYRAIAQEREVAQAEVRQCVERVNGVVQTVNGERNKRELALQHVDKRIQDMHCAFDEEVMARRREFAAQDARIQEMRAVLDDERQERDALECRQNTGMRDLRERLELVFSQHAKMMEDQVAVLKDFPVSTNCVDDINRQMFKIRTDAEFAASESNSRFLELEHRTCCLETRVTDNINGQAVSVDRLLARHEKTSQAVEQLKIEHKQDQSQVHDMIQAISRLESTFNNAEGETRDIMLKERLLRDDQLRRARQAMCNEQARQIAEVERKLVERLEQESAMRESSVSEIVGEVAKVFDAQKMVDRASAAWLEEAAMDLTESPASVITTRVHSPPRVASGTSIYEPKALNNVGSVATPVASSTTPGRAIASSPVRHNSPIRTGTKGSLSLPSSSVQATVSEVPNFVKDGPEIIVSLASSRQQLPVYAPSSGSVSLAPGQPLQSAEVTHVGTISAAGSCNFSPGPAHAMDSEVEARATVLLASPSLGSVPSGSVTRAATSPVRLLSQRETSAQTLTRQSSGRAPSPRAATIVNSRQSSLGAVGVAGAAITTPLGSRGVTVRTARPETPRTARAAATQAAMLSGQRSPTSSVGVVQKVNLRSNASCTPGTTAASRSTSQRGARPASQNSRSLH